MIEGIVVHVCMEGVLTEPLKFRICPSISRQLTQSVDLHVQASQHTGLVMISSPG